jgi:Pvc16 N-terminal domain
VIVDIPLNTMVADLDGALRKLLKRDLAPHGFGGVTVTFEAPTRDWAAKLSGPTVNLFLYDLCEATSHRTVEWQSSPADGTQRELRPPLQLAASYAVTVWTQAVEDEHRLLSQVIGVLYAHPALPSEVLDGTLARAEPPETSLAQPRTDRRNEFWTAIGGQYKPSVDYAVVLPFPSGRAVERGAPVRSRAVRAQLGEVVEERHLVTGRVCDARGEPAADCWLVLDGDRRAVVTDADGAFAIDGLTPGCHRGRARATDGGTADVELVVPGLPVEVRLNGTVGQRKRPR